MYLLISEELERHVDETRKIYLTNGVRIEGTVSSIVMSAQGDVIGIIVRGEGKRNLIYTSAIATILEVEGDE